MGKIRNEQETYSRDMGFDQKIEYDVSNNPIYVGRTFPNVQTSTASWQIYRMKYDSNNNMTDLRWADGNDKFDKIWDNRATYTYIGF